MPTALLANLFSVPGFLLHDKNISYGCQFSGVFVKGKQESHGTYNNFFLQLCSNVESSVIIYSCIKCSACVVSKLMQSM
jgi:hypothetical protein